MKKLINNIIILASFVGLLWGLYQYFENHYAKAEDIAQVQQTIQSLQQSIIYDHLLSERKGKQERAWSLSDRFENTSKAPAPVREELRQLNQDIQDLNDKIKIIEQKVK